MKHQHTAGTGCLLHLTSQPTRVTGGGYGPYTDVTLTGDVVTDELTKHMEKNPSEEADSSSASGNYPHLMEAEWREARGYHSGAAGVMLYGSRRFGSWGLRVRH